MPMSDKELTGMINSYFSFSRGRSGYSGVDTYCKDSATPFAAEEGLTGLLTTNHKRTIECYGDQGEFSSVKTDMKQLR
ncbi:hypothetical protein J4Q44_G00259030 [Coregonus suidteri]|uniref:Uncharacterized protein n=1 Tax=Coregonus suidteri TaxID=861788 RepID=A0AAN8L7P4_9TELE